MANLRFFVSLDDAKRPIGETLIYPVEARMVSEEEATALGRTQTAGGGPVGPDARDKAVSGRLEGPLPFGYVLGDFLSLAPSEFLEKWAPDANFYPWGHREPVSRGVPWGLARWKFERDGLKRCVDAWCTSESGVTAFTHKGFRDLPGVEENVRLRLSRVRLEPASAYAGSQRQFFRALRGIEDGDLKDVPSRLERFAWHYITDDILAIPWLELFKCLEHNMRLIPCGACGRLFAPLRGSICYCDECRHPEKRRERYGWSHYRGKYNAVHRDIEHLKRNPDDLKVALRIIRENPDYRPRPKSTPYRILRKLARSLVEKGDLTKKEFEEYFGAKPVSRNAPLR
ncbi:MAG TPA: hypothetical protein GX507_01930 [Clostridia bacterium]|nr:hypothetical protein [Clostridia bacterium]